MDTLTAIRGSDRRFTDRANVPLARHHGGELVVETTSPSEVDWPPHDELPQRLEPGPQSWRRATALLGGSGGESIIREWDDPVIDSGTSTSSRVTAAFHKFASKASDFLSTVAGFCIFISGPLFLVYALLDGTRLSEAEKIPWFIIVIYAWTAFILFWLSVLSAQELAEKRVDWGSALVLTLVIVGAPIFLVVLGGSVVTNLAIDGRSVVLDPQQSRLLSSDIYEQLLWEVADTVPLVKVPGTVGWERPIADPDLPLAVAAVMVRISMVLVTLGALGDLFIRRRSRPSRPEDDLSNEDGATQ